MKTLVIDYGSGNIHSCAKALSATGYDVSVSNQPQHASSADILVLPGQGHFGQVMQSFLASGFEDSVRNHIAAGKPFLGICVGMQILYQGSEEAPEVAGLGLVDGTVKKFVASRVPQIGWNTVQFEQPFEANQGHFYFVHSYYAPLGEGSVGVAQYQDIKFTAVYAKHNVVAPQFHPEKSSTAGLQLLHTVQDYFKTLF